MELPTDLLDDLATLDDALGDGTDLARDLGTLVRLLVEAVPSLVAVAITVTIDGYPVEIGMTPDGAAARSSIAIAMPSSAADEVSSQLIAYANDLTAFTDFRADAIHGMSIHPDAISLDAHVNRDQPATSLTELSIINQAVGILVDRGHTPTDARTFLQRNAESRGLTPLAHPRALITDAADPRGDDVTD